MCEILDCPKFSLWWLQFTRFHLLHCYSRLLPALKLYWKQWDFAFNKTLRCSTLNYICKTVVSGSFTFDCNGSKLLTGLKMTVCSTKVDHALARYTTPASVSVSFQWISYTFEGNNMILFLVPLFGLLELGKEFSPSCLGAVFSSWLTLIITSSFG